ncbi:acyl carrier protein [Streptomyces daliensis]|uniref:Acyl carrier protein n=1 Tax=Streptomyces daliensis TaxID=299421 RepID=A0A8T4IZI5_9ACTN|nr:acyl carrier protein [Streptomyces daliensis]
MPALTLPPDVINWVYEQNPDVEDIDPDLDLFDSRLVNSLSLIEFVIVIEEASGRTIDRRNLKTDQFQTLRTIQETFFNGAS